MAENVLIVGAGPVGLTAGVELRRRGVECRIIDRLLAPIPYAKAVGVQPRTLELWESAGVLARALDASTPMRGQLVYVNGEQVAKVDFELPPEVPYGFAALPQYETERLLEQRYNELGGHVERGVELVRFEQDAEGVSVKLRGPDGESQLRAGYLIGADGAHSTVRKGLGLKFEGDAFPEQYMLGDVEVDWHQPSGYAIRAQHIGDGGNVDDLLVAIPLPGRRRYRVSMLVPEELSAQDNGSTLSHDGDGAEKSVEHGMSAGPRPELRHIQAVLDRLAPEPTHASHLRWSSVFRISHRIVDSYGTGRVFVAGDAAHIHPPTGAQGMNTGIQDAVALAWRVALAAQGDAADGLLASYDAERRPVGEEVVGRTVRHARSGYESDDPATVILREAQLLVSYPDSPIVSGDNGAGELKGGPAPGERAPDCRGLRRACVAFPLRLYEVLDGCRHTLLVYVDQAEQIAELAAAGAAIARARERDHLDARIILADEADIPDNVADGLLGGTPVPVLRDAAGEFRAAYSAVGGCCYLVRPDGHVGYRAARLRGDDLATHLALVFA
ncbi:FAD-dependent monooxygenase [Pseudonocardia sp. CA-142604]|uniref:FAD-dependent monooxygenase n=1 Tax=Pseudonocardia sp. CA-142604 TaxID=3240024 RepID=UPI003D94CF8E